MKILRLTAALFFFTLPAFSQNVTVTYDIIPQVAIPGRPPIKAVLTDEGARSKYVVQLTPDREGLVLVKDKKSAFCYFETPGYGGKYSIKDSLHNMKWRLTAKSQTILGYPCLSATTKFRGRSYTAYYTTKLPNANGPEKLGGLPGLILAAKTDDDFLGWRATSVVLGPVPPIDLAKVQARENMDWKTFVAKYKEGVRRQTKYIRSKGNIPDDSKMELLVPSLEYFGPNCKPARG